MFKTNFKFKKNKGMSGIFRHFRNLISTQISDLPNSALKCNFIFGRVLKFKKFNLLKLKSRINVDMNKKLASRVGNSLTKQNNNQKQLKKEF
jgi:hypothetical protein